jgi:hypothetical protein
MTMKLITSGYKVFFIKFITCLTGFGKKKRITSQYWYLATNVGLVGIGDFLRNFCL